MKAKLPSIQNLTIKRLKPFLKKHCIVCISTLFCLATLVLVYFVLDIAFFSYHRKEFAKEARAAANAVDYFVGGNEILGLTKCLGLDSRLLKDVLNEHNRPDNPEILASLESIRIASDASIVYVMDQNGDVVSCTPYGDGKTLTGNNYRFRPYFQRAINGVDTVYPALGVTTNKRGLYYASPVYQHPLYKSNNAIIGIIVIKTSLKDVDELLMNIHEPVAMVSSTGLVFSSNQKDWFFKSAYPLSDSLKAKLAASKQFSNLFTKNSPESIPFYLNTDVVNHGNTQYAVISQELNIADEIGPWKLVFLQNTKGWLPLWFLIFSNCAVAGIYLMSTIAYITYGKNRRTEKEKQKVLKESTEIYQTIFNTSNDVIFVHDAESGDVFDVNHQCHNVLGYTVEEIKEKNISWITHAVSPFSKDDALRMMKRTIESGDHLFEWIMTKVNNDPIWLSVSLKSCRIKERDCILAGIRDITDRKIAARELAESDRKIRTLMASLPGMAYRCQNDESWTMEFISQGCLLLTGYEPADIINNNKISYEDLICKEDRNYVRDVVSQSLENRRFFEIEYRIKTKSGKTKWVWEKGQGVYLDDGEIVAIEGFILDIADRREAEQVIKNQKELLSNILANSPYQIYWKDCNSVYLGCNENFAKAAGMKSSEEIVGKTDYDLAWKKEEAEFFRKCDEQVFQIGESLLNIEETQRQSGGREAFMLASKVPLKDNDDNIIGMMGVSADITERKRLENDLKSAKEEAELARHMSQIVNKQLEESIERANLMAKEAVKAERAKSDFLTNMSHEIRTPMNSIIGFTDILADQVQDESQKKYLGIIRDNSAILMNVIESILDFSKIEAGRIEFECVQTRVHDMVNIIELLMRPMAEKKAINFKVITCPDLPEIINTDPVRLKQCIINLISNAIKFTNAGHVYLNISKERQDDTDYLRIDVEDTGIGISPEKSEMIFDSFAQVDSGASRQYSGMGLGLAITRQLITMIGGKISFISHENKGSVFTLLVPEKLNQKASCAVN